MKWTRIGTMAAFVAAVAIGLALSLGLWANWSAGAAGTEHVVNQDTGTGDPAPCDAPDFPSVSDLEAQVIEKAEVVDGDTLVLCPGTYTAGAAAGAVEVDKQLTIEGLDTADREDVVVKGSSHGFTIIDDNVKIKHLKLEGPGTAAADRGINLEPVGPTAYKNAELSDLEITNWNIGVYIAASDDTKIGPNNDIHGNAVGALIAATVLGGRRDRVFNNVIGPNLGVGIQLATIDEAYIQENTLAGNGNIQMYVGGESNAFIWNNNIEATTSLGIHIASATADTLVQIGGSPGRANNFTGTLVTPPGFYASLDCGSENTVDATYNYWNGINDPNGIKAVVFNDEFDDPTTGPDCAGDDKGAVAVHPFVTTMWTPTPTVTPSPTATATGTPTPTTTPSGATRDVDLSPAGWHDLAWSGADGTAPATALACISGDYSIAYAWNAATGKFERYVEGCAEPALCNMGPLDKYDSLMVLISAANVTCVMPIAP